MSHFSPSWIHFLLRLDKQYTEGNANFPTWKVGKETQQCLKSTWSKVNDLRITVFLFVQESRFIFPCVGITRFRAWNLVIYMWIGTCAQRAKSTKCCKGLRKDSWDAWQNSQKQRDRYSGRDLVLPRLFALFATILPPVDLACWKQPGLRSSATPGSKQRLDSMALWRVGSDLLISCGLIFNMI